MLLYPFCRFCLQGRSASTSRLPHFGNCLLVVFCVEGDGRGYGACGRKSWMKERGMRRTGSLEPTSSR